MTLEISSINNGAELENCNPETVKFHSTFKGIARMLIKYLPFSKIDEETYATHLTGNCRIFYEIIKKWEEVEGRQHRKDVLTKPLKIGLFTMANDSDFREVFNFMTSEIIRRRKELYFPPHHLDPTCWTNDKTNIRRTPGVYIPPEMISNVIIKGCLVLKAPLPPQLYWCAIKPGLEHHYAINSNLPFEHLPGEYYAYEILKDYGDAGQFNSRIVMGD